MSKEAEINYREEILRLISEGKIKHTTKYVEKASDETLEKIYKSYVAKQLDETNEQITNTLITQLSELLTSLEMVEEPEELSCCFLKKFYKYYRIYFFLILYRSPQAFLPTCGRSNILFRTLYPLED